jgi:hypothetical protein
MQMTHANIESLSPAATYVATGTSRRQKPSGFLRLDDNQALARRCYR